MAALTRDFDEIVESSALDPPDDEHDPDGSTIAFERAQIAALLAQAKADVAALDGALDRLASGRYGMCRRCGRPIGDERLQALPTTETCITCAS